MVAGEQHSGKSHTQQSQKGKRESWFLAEKRLWIFKHTTKSVVWERENTFPKNSLFFNLEAPRGFYGWGWGRLLVLKVWALSQFFSCFFLFRKIIALANQLPVIRDNIALFCSLKNSLNLVLDWWGKVFEITQGAHKQPSTLPWTSLLKVQR